MNYDPHNTTLLLEQYLDGTLSPDQSNRLKALLEADPALREELEALQLAIEAARHKGLYTRVKGIRNAMFENKQESTKRTPVLSMVRKTMSLAAGLIILAGAFAIYKYASVTKTSVYNDLYLQYEPGTTRSIQTDPVDEAYRQKNWKEVITLAEKNPDNNKYLFLAGMANLESGQQTAAIARFEKIQQSNKASGNNYFNDEAEYYLAMAYIRNDEAAKATALLQTISNTPDHVYREKADNASRLNLRILNWKDK